MTFFNSTSDRWVKKNGTIHVETQKQRHAVLTPAFQLSLRLYRHAYTENLPTAESQRTTLNDYLQKAYDAETFPLDPSNSQ